MKSLFRKDWTRVNHYSASEEIDKLHSLGATVWRVARRAVGFDFDGAAFTHTGDKVTFEVLMESFGLESIAGLNRVAALVHYLDVGGIPLPEAAGFESLLRAARDTFADDDALLGEAAKLFELIHLSYHHPVDD